MTVKIKISATHVYLAIYMWLFSVSYLCYWIHIR